MFVHTVYFWLKAETGDAERDQLLEDCRTLLTKIESVRHLWAGLPAGTPRAVVDNTYAVALTVVLDDVAGHDAYQVDPLHKEFVARNGPNFDHIQIYDAIG